MPTSSVWALCTRQHGAVSRALVCHHGSWLLPPLNLNFSVISANHDTAPSLTSSLSITRISALTAQGGCEEEERMEVKMLREKQKQTPVSGRDQCDSSAFKEDTGGQRTRLGWRGEMARGLSVAGEHSLSALQADSVTQCGCHLTWVPQEHSRKIMTAEGLGPPLEQRSLTAWLTLETQPSPQPGPRDSRSTSQLL